MPTYKWVLQQHGVYSCVLQYSLAMCVAAAFIFMHACTLCGASYTIQMQCALQQLVCTVVCCNGCSSSTDSCNVCSSIHMHATGSHSRVTGSHSSRLHGFTLHVAAYLSVVIVFNVRCAGMHAHSCCSGCIEQLVLQCGCGDSNRSVCECSSPVCSTLMYFVCCSIHVHGRKVQQGPIPAVC
jgi:hypothetical protein